MILDRVGASLETSICWLVVDTAQDVQLMDREYCAYVTGYYPPFDPAMNVAESLSSEEKASLSWVREAIIDAVMIGDEVHPVFSFMTPSLAMQEAEDDKVKEEMTIPNQRVGIVSPPFSIAISFRRMLTQQEVFQLYARAQTFAKMPSSLAQHLEPFVILGYRVIEEKRTQICTAIGFEASQR